MSSRRKNKFYKDVENFGATFKQPKIKFSTSSSSSTSTSKTVQKASATDGAKTPNDHTNAESLGDNIEKDELALPEKLQLLVKLDARLDRMTQRMDKELAPFGTGCDINDIDEKAESAEKNFEVCSNEITNKLEISGLHCIYDKLDRLDHKIDLLNKKTESDIEELAKKVNTANENIGKLNDSVNEIKRNLEALNNRLGSGEQSVAILENDYKLFKTKIDRLTETMYDWNKERVSRKEFTDLDDKVESTLQDIKEGDHQEIFKKVKELKQSKKQAKDETTIVLNRLPKKPNQLPQALITSLHILLGLPIMSLPVNALDKDNTALAINLGSKENLENYCKQIKRGLKMLQNSKPSNKELIRVSKMVIEPFFDEPLNGIKKHMKSKASELFTEYKLRSHRFIRSENTVKWVLKAEKPDNLSDKNIECLKILAMDGPNDLVDVSETMSGFENYVYDENYCLLIRDWSK